jgi:hypothetical protein
VADPLAGGDAVAGWREELWAPIFRVEPYLPGGVVEDSVVFSAEQHEVVQARGAAVGPVGDVVGVAHDRWAGAAGEGAVPVAGDQCPPLGGADQPAGLSQVEDLAFGAEDDGDEVGVAGESADGGDGEVEPVVVVLPRWGRRSGCGSGRGSR